MQKIVSMLLFLGSLALLYGSLSYFITNQLGELPPFQEQTALPAQQSSTLSMTASQLGCQVAASTPSSLYAKAYCVIDADTGRVLCGKNENQQLPMASTTKIMTCILALESGQLEDMVTVSSYAASMPDVQLNIREGEQYVLKDLLYSLMLESHNDTAVAIAEHLGGSVEGFASLMNTKAQELGCTATHFVTPNGLDDDQHYTTAQELCLIGAYAVQNEDFLKIIRTSSYQFKEQSGSRSFTVNNHDAFLQQYDGAIGIKTGFTGNAGYCFCGAARRKDRTLISSVLACGWPPNKTYKWTDTKKLMNYGFEGFETCEIPLREDTPVLPVENGQQDFVSLLRQEDQAQTLRLPLRAEDSVTIRWELPEKLTAPVRSGDVIGYENYLLNEECYQSIPLIAGQNVDAVDQAYLLRVLSKLFLFAGETACEQ